MSLQIKTYLIITFIISWISWSLLALLSYLHLTTTTDALGFFLFFLGGSASTFVVYIAIKKAKTETIADFHRRVFRFNVSIWFYLYAFAVPLLIVMIGQIYYRLSFEEFYTSAMIIDPITILIFFASTIIFGGIEEFGWRGIVQDGWQHKISLLRLNLLLGTIWAFWHLPVFFVEGQSLQQANFVIFYLSCLGYSGLMTWLYARTRSVALTVFFHAMINALGAIGWQIPISEDGPYLWMSLTMIFVSVVLLKYDRQTHLHIKENPNETI